MIGYSRWQTGERPSRRGWAQNSGPFTCSHQPVGQQGSLELCWHGSAVVRAQHGQGEGSRRQIPLAAACKHIQMHHLDGLRPGEVHTNPHASKSYSPQQEREL